MALAVVLATGGSEESAGETQSVTVTVGETVAETVTVTETVTETEPVPDDDGVGLPPAVAETRRELLAAAEAEDHDRLATLAPADFSYSFGGPVEGGPAAYWRQIEEDGQQPLEALSAVLSLPYALSGGLYVWPFAHAIPPDGLTAYERELLEDIPGGATISGEGYLGWRTGIEPDGTWRFFVAGD